MLVQVWAMLSPADVMPGSADDVPGSADDVLVQVWAMLGLPGDFLIKFHEKPSPGKDAKLKILDRRKGGFVRGEGGLDQ